METRDSLQPIQATTFRRSQQSTQAGARARNRQQAAGRPGAGGTTIAARVSAMALLASLALGVITPGPTVAQVIEIDESMCGELKNHYGPYDYRTASRDSKILVEGAHFTRDVENLKGFYNETRGIRSPVGGDLDYTLRAFPNHPRALWTMVRLSIRDKTEKPKGARYPVECYFNRAVRFRPDDLTVRVLYANFLLKRGRTADAITQIDVADKAGDDQSANFYYNLGLALFEVARYDRARERAKQAYDLGFPLEGLKEKLVKAGKWEG